MALDHVAPPRHQVCCSAMFRLSGLRFRVSDYEASTSQGMQRPQGSSQRPSISPAPQRHGSSHGPMHRQGNSPAMQRSNSSAAMHRQGSSSGLNRQGSLAALLRQGSSPALQNALLRQASDRLKQGTASPAHVASAQCIPGLLVMLGTPTAAEALCRGRGAQPLHSAAWFQTHLLWLLLRTLLGMRAVLTGEPLQAC